MNSLATKGEYKPSMESGGADQTDLHVANHQY